jgi:triacylglycerol esterase/lipase EstA (alpha/beta hydrolase family)
LEFSESLKPKKNGKINFTIIGHSLGGLYSRNALKFLWKNNFQEKFHFKQYISLSTPHLGSRRSKEGFTGFFIGKAVDLYLSFSGKTGLELGLYDNDQLLLKMSRESEYLDPLNHFESKVTVAISHYDLSVTFPSSYITYYNPFKSPEYGEFKFKFLESKEIPKIEIDSEFISDNLKSSEIHVEMMENLNKINWKKVAIEFQIEGISKQVLVHTMIVKKKMNYILNSESLEKVTKDWIDNGLLKLIIK